VVGDEQLSAENLTSAADVLPHLSGYPRLLDLTLTLFSFTEADLHALAARMPLMLSIYNSELPSLAPLSGATMAQLVIRECPGFSLAHLLPPRQCSAALLVARRSAVRGARICQRLAV
jgi:hypothetical protein